MVNNVPRNDNCFDFIRLFASTSVLFAHVIGNMEISFLWADPGTKYWFYDGVPLFFILSGFLVYKSYDNLYMNKKPILYYFINRFLRIAPAIYAYALVTLILLLSIGILNIDNVLSIGFLGWLSSNMVLIPVYHPTIFDNFGIGVLNGSLWTIPVEFSFYMILPLMYWIEKKKSSFMMFVVIGIVAFFGLYIDWKISLENAESIVEKFYSISFIPYLIYFLMGIFWLRMWDKTPKNYLLAIVGVVLYWVIHLDILSINLGPFRGFIKMLPLSYSIIWFGFNAPKFFKNFTNFGDISYGVYIWHMVIVNIFIYYGVSRSFDHNLVSFSIFSITFILAFLSWKFVEKPSLKLKKFSSRQKRLESRRIHANRTTIIR